ncbi:hypothetical protein HY411_02015, partial [Candidatus Gottesmanbacteria bacterium]|nr:hypothetical protein [Candidatus Gottesmanbacteria bacterium]
MSSTAPELLTILVADGHLKQDQAEAVRLESLNSGITIEDILVKKKLVPESVLIQARAKVLGIPFLTLEGKAKSPDVITYNPEPVA